MAEINTGGGGGKKGGGKVRSKKASTSVDMTPMVDLGFLLITFFILATTLSKPSSMTLNVPDKTKQEETEPIKASNVMTAFLGKDNKVHYIFGKAASEDPEVKTVSMGYDFRKAVQDESRKVPGDKFVIVIKPTKESTYKTGDLTPWQKHPTTQRSTISSLRTGIKPTVPTRCASNTQPSLRGR